MLTPDDIQNGNVLTGPDGDLRVAGRVQTDAGQFVVLTNESGVGSLIQDGTLYDHEDYSLKSRLAASGVASAQEASEVDALRAEVDRQSRLVQALLDREGTQRQVTQAEAAQPDPVPEVPGPAALPPEAEGQDVVAPGVNVGPATGPGGVPPGPQPGPQGPTEA